MGGSKSKHYTYTDNSPEINAKIDTIRGQLNNLNKDLNSYQTEVQSHIDMVQKKFTHFDNNIKLIQYEFEESFGFVNQGIKMLTNDIGTMSQLQIEYEKSNSREHWEMYQNDWKENFERNVFEELQRLKNMKLELELDLQKKIGSYLLLKDKFNGQVILYEKKKNDYKFNLNDAKLNWLFKKMIQGTISNSADLVNSVGSANTVDLMEFDDLTNSKLSAESAELIELESSIQYPPELDQGIEQLYMMTNRFEEILKIELRLKETVKTMMTNFSNPNLINPLDDIVVGPREFATKLYNSGINTLSQIVFSSQTKLLVSNGYAYVPEYKYKDLRKKFIVGCESTGEPESSSKLILDWEHEDMEWLAQYIYSKIQDKIKSISSMVGHMGSNPKSIYRIKPELLDEPEKIGLIGFELWKGLTTINTISLLDMSEETNPIILYNIFVSKGITRISQISNELLTQCGYNVISEFGIKNLQRLIYLVDQNKTYGKNLFEPLEQEQIENITQFDNDKLNQMITFVVTEYMRKKKSDKNFKFQFDRLDALYAQRFFNEIIRKLLQGYIEIIFNQFTNSNGTDIKISEQVYESIYSNESVRFDSSIVGPVWKFNSVGDLKIFIGFCFSQIYKFYWNKETA